MQQALRHTEVCALQAQIANWDFSKVNKFLELREGVPLDEIMGMQ